MNVPDALIYPLQQFAADFAWHVDEGTKAFADAEVVFVGLARNCGQHLAHNLHRLELLVQGCRSWRLHIETNDNDDDTDQVLTDFCAAYRQATFTSQRLGRQQFSAEFAGPRTQALAEYRTACQRWVQENSCGADFVVIIDWDAWGGWSHSGVLHGLGRLMRTQDACGMASVSLIQHRMMQVDANGKAAPHTSWIHYDAWALRLNSTWDDYTAGCGGWKHSWIPPVGSPPIPVVSAFGGLAIYDTYAYLKGTYDGSDCEHVTFHATMAERTRKRMFLDPGMRTVMHWLEGKDAKAGQHSDD